MPNVVISDAGFLQNTSRQLRNLYLWISLSKEDKIPLKRNYNPKINRKYIDHALITTYHNINY